ncbi:MAG: DNA-binding response regulator [Oceanospirillaceae bacterium]|uniref:response regulator transcription factor n=1 Tax=unclassified Thalassolituus TaxID=2624967 RepID=UPI000C0968D1|nr:MULTISPECIES: response regulator transcription factor [unclassified Thalassolituus]MAK90077.1 DNA-binding response regulator [Thalassolituus sp.]MAX99370.1 DNA-binding response regulator [Oceanospirillaceae bacterium]MBS52137.1 DNA-binding response regulator [Oceanospirillaceae bacterium]|tara:strand:- start:2538 stop:3143 length:606 start_codon:yes stop_codon:yes gene_type:complete
MTVKVLVSDDHELYRDGLRRLLQEAIADIEILEADSFPSTQQALFKHNDVSLLLLDIHMPGTRGLEGLKQIKADYPVLPLIVVSSEDQQASIRQMLELGADGFISKTSSKAIMIAGVKKFMAGEQVIITGEEQTEALILSPRQIDTLELMAKGLSNKEIAEKLGISPATVREYVSDILALFQSTNRTQAALKARQAGYILD